MKGLDATRENVILYILLFIILLFTLDTHCEQYPDLNNSNLNLITTIEKKKKVCQNVLSNCFCICNQTHLPAKQSAFTQHSIKDWEGGRLWVPCLPMVPLSTSQHIYIYKVQNYKLAI